MDITVKLQRCRTPLSSADVRYAAQQMLRAYGVRRAELSVVFLDGATIRKLNRDFLGHDFVTDVVTFDFQGYARNPIVRRWTLDVSWRPASGVQRLAIKVPACIDGEIYICPAEARRNAKLYGEPISRELLRYLAHGILHLLGLDDSTPAERDRMRQSEDELLSLLGTPDTGHKTQE